MHSTDLSAEALAFLAAYESSDEHIDFSRIDKIRDEVKSSFAPGAERAIARHALHCDTQRIAGVKCERIRSTRRSESTGSLMYLFGGGFITGCPQSDLPIIGALAEYCGVEVIAPYYRLAPEHPAPAAADDCMAVYREMTGANESRLLLAGESAGGNLALVVAQRARAEGVALPDAMALLSPAADMRTDHQLFEPTFRLDPTLTPTIIEDVRHAYVRDSNPCDPEISPLFGGLEDLPPTIITTGTRDMLMPMCLRLTRAMHRAGVRVDTRVWNGLWHVFEYYDQYPEADESLREIAVFLNETRTSI